MADMEPVDVRIWEDENGYSPFEAWMDRLDDTRAWAVDLCIQELLIMPKDVLIDTRWLKSVSGVYQFSINHPANRLKRKLGVETVPVRRLKKPDEKLLLRVWLGYKGNTAWLLHGWDKGSAGGRTKPEQNRQIQIARKYWARAQALGLK